jgi:hypothetical protein
MDSNLDLRGNAVCTIVTPNYVPYALALYESICAHTEHSVDMWIFVSVLKQKLSSSLPSRTGVHYVFVDDLCGNSLGKELMLKYLDKNINAFRWSMKSVLLMNLLMVQGYKKAIFLDGDLFFFSDVQLLFDKLDHSRVLLTPHWRSKDPKADESNFLQLFNRGIFNAGFVGVNSEAIDILKWWADMCIYKCEFDSAAGFYADQTYLNLMPVYFDGVEVLRHKGCNVAAWNRLECVRSMDSQGTVLIGGLFPIVFVHFTASIIREILIGKDPMLVPHLDAYATAILKHGGPNILEQVVKPQRRASNISNVKRLAFLVKKRIASFLQ